MIYREFDEVERPADDTINDDKKLDKWMVRYRAENRKKLIQYHKDDKGVDRDPLDRAPSKSYGR